MMNENQLVKPQNGLTLWVPLHFAFDYEEYYVPIDALYFAPNYKYYLSFTNVFNLSKEDRLLIHYLSNIKINN